MLSSNLSDQELVKKYINGDNYSFEVLLNRHKNRVFAFIMSKIKNKDNGYANIGCVAVSSNKKNHCFLCVWI